jgi:hypothetical protein
MTREENHRLQFLFDDGMAMLTSKVETLSQALYDEVNNLKEHVEAAKSRMTDEGAKVRLTACLLRDTIPDQSTCKHLQSQALAVTVLQ